MVLLKYGGSLHSFKKPLVPIYCLTGWGGVSGKRSLLVGDVRHSAVGKIPASSWLGVPGGPAQPSWWPWTLCSWPASMGTVTWELLLFCAAIVTSPLKVGCPQTCPVGGPLALVCLTTAQGRVLVLEPGRLKLQPAAPP